MKTTTELVIPETDLSENKMLEFIDVNDEPVSTLSPLMRKVASIAKKAKDREICSDLVPSPSGDMQQLDLFVADLLDYNLKDDTATMEAPLFSLSTKPDLDPWKWFSPDKKKWLEVTPSTKGRATIHD